MHTKINNTVVVLSVCASVLGLFGANELDGIDETSLSPCKNNAHFTDPDFTCCGFEKYNVSSILQRKHYRENGFNCPPLAEGPIVKSAWSYFECVLKYFKIPSATDWGTFAQKVSEPYPTDVASLIVKKVQEIESSGKLVGYEGNELIGEFVPLANMRKAYYLAEKMVCTELGAKKKDMPLPKMEKESENCLSWKEQTDGRGDCCGSTPIPYQLFPNPMVLQYFALKNYTANHVLNIAGKEFNWRNVSVVVYSDYIVDCRRTATLILQEKITFSGLKDLVMSQTRPNYTEIANMIIPRYFSEALRTTVRDIMLNETIIKNDYVLNTIQDRSVSVFSYINPGEWKNSKISENGTRYLMWYCRAHTLLDKQYKDVDVSTVRQNIEACL